MNLDWLLQPFLDEARSLIDFILNDENGSLEKQHSQKVEYEVARLLANAHDDAVELI
jgi:hypothetical protein